MFNKKFFRIYKDEGAFKFEEYTLVLKKDYYLVVEDMEGEPRFIKLDRDDEYEYCPNVIFHHFDDIVESSNLLNEGSVNIWYDGKENLLELFDNWNSETSYAYVGKELWETNLMIKHITETMNNLDYLKKRKVELEEKLKEFRKETTK